VAEPSSQYNASRPELSVPSVQPAPEEVDALNAGQTIVINLATPASFQPSGRTSYVDLRVSAIETEPESGGYGRTAFVDLQIAHSGISTSSWMARSTASVTTTG
jgi:hypothetical protein